MNNFPSLNGYFINDLPPHCTFVTMKKTVSNGVKTIDILFKDEKADKHYLVKYDASNIKGKSYKETWATFFTDSVNNNKSRYITNKNKVYSNKLSVFNQDIRGQTDYKIHEKNITKLYSDDEYVVTQSTHPNIRFSVIKHPIAHLNVKELSNSYLIDYNYSHAVWAKKRFLNSKMVDIYVGFKINADQKSFILKKDIHDFVLTEKIFSMPFFKETYMPACYIEGNTVVLYNERQKQINIIQFNETTDINNKKISDTIKTSLNIADCKPKKKYSDNDVLLYKVPFKIDYDITNNIFILVYRDFIVKIEQNNQQYSIPVPSYTHWTIVDVIIENHKTAYVLWFNDKTDQWYITIHQL